MSTLRISFHERLVSTAKWKTGWPLDVEIMDGMAHVFGSPTGAKLTVNGKGAKRSHVRFRMPREMLEGFPEGEGTEVEVQPDRVAFLLPDYAGSASDRVT